jgi:hypothetical protein
MEYFYKLDSLNNISKENDIKGIYLWGVVNGSKCIPLYVGRRIKIHERIFQHLCRWRGGEYRIPAWDDIVNPNPVSIPFTKNPNLLYIPYGPLVYEDFLTNKDVQFTIQKVLDNFFCCWEFLPNYETSPEEEDAIATLINKDKLISTHRTSATSETEFAKKFYKDFQGASTNYSIIE